RSMAGPPSPAVRSMSPASPPRRCDSRGRRERSREWRPGSAGPAMPGGVRRPTTWALPHHLVEGPRLTEITNSAQVADVLHRAGRADQTVVLVGGVRTPSDALVGPVAIAAIRSLNVDMLMLGVHGMSTRAGFTTPNLLEAETDRELVAAARRLVVLADH